MHVCMYFCTVVFIMYVYMDKNLGPSRYIGWVCYFSVEAYGSLMVAIFWSFTNSIMDLEQAKGDSIIAE